MASQQRAGHEREARARRRQSGLLAVPPPFMGQGDSEFAFTGFVALLA